jgi:hypothetical protein
MAGPVNEAESYYVLLHPLTWRRLGLILLLEAGESPRPHCASSAKAYNDRAPLAGLVSKSPILDMPFSRARRQLPLPDNHSLACVQASAL